MHQPALPAPLRESSRKMSAMILNTRANQANRSMNQKIETNTSQRPKSSIDSFSLELVELWMVDGAARVATAVPVRVTRAG